MQRRMSTRGYTFMELMMTVVVISIIASIAIPSYQKTVRRAQLRAMIDVLHTIFAGEQTYRAFNTNQYLAIPASLDSTGWDLIYMDNPNRVVPGIRFGIIHPGGPSSGRLEVRAQLPDDGFKAVLLVDETGRISKQSCTPAGRYTQRDCDGLALPPP